MKNINGDNNNDVDFSQLINGEIIECQACHKGHYVPDHVDVKTEYYYHCDNCGDKVRLEPIVDYKKLFGIDT